MFKMWKAAFMVLVALCWGCYPKATSQRPLCSPISARPAQIPDGLVRRVRNINRRKFPGTQETGEFFRVPPIGFDPFPGLARNQRRGDDHAFNTQLLRTPRDNETAGSGFITGANRACAPAPDPADQFFQSMEVVADRAGLAHLPVPSGLGYPPR
jgi:hypothetical protein